MAALADHRFKGMQHDDEGENISYKNPYYCELTAQYWAWKNLDADYYGLFHYRRYFSFSDEHFRTNRSPMPSLIPTTRKRSSVSA